MNTDHVVVKDNTLWCKACGQREPLRLPLSVKDFSHFCQTWAQAHALCLEVAQSKLVTSMREAINALPFVPHSNGCLAFDTVPCCCGAAAHNAALERVRRAAGLDDENPA